VVHLRSLFIEKFTSWITISSQFLNTKAMHESNVWNVCNKFIISSLLTKTKKKRSAFILVAIRSR
jgi:LPS O-antigen subunit length determinant protein (WzzB/FepE family)